MGEVAVIFQRQQGVVRGADENIGIGQKACPQARDRGQAQLRAARHGLGQAGA